MAGENTETLTPPDCTEELAKLYAAIQDKMTSKQRTRVRYEDQEAEYSQVSLKDLQEMYMVWWNQCGAGSGYPDLTTGKQVRGAPAQVRVG